MRFNVDKQKKRMVHKTYLRSRKGWMALSCGIIIFFTLFNIIFAVYGFADKSTFPVMDPMASATMQTVNGVSPKIARCTFIFVDSNLMEQGENIQNALYDKGAYGSYILYFSDNLMNRSIDQLVRQREEFKSVTFNVFTE